MDLLLTFKKNKQRITIYTNLYFTMLKGKTRTPL